MNDILFISDADIDPQLELARRSILENGFSLSLPCGFDAGYQLVSRGQVSFVLINALDKKFEAYDFCLKLKSLQQLNLKIFVYLQGASANEASKFGKLDAEVIDSSSVQILIETLRNQAQHSYIAKQDLISIVSLDGGLGVSALAILLSSVLSDYQYNSILIESNNKFSIREILGIESQHSFLGRDRSLEHKQSYDNNWFGAFLNSSPKISTAKYLNLFNDLSERIAYTEKTSDYASAIATALIKIASNNELEEQSKILSSSLNLLARDIKGDPAVLFDELIKFATRFTDQIIVDLGQDIYSSLNKQFLSLSKNIIVIFGDKPGVRNNLLSLRSDLERRYKAKLIPVMVIDEINYRHYHKLTENDWQELLSVSPLLYQREPELISAFIYDDEALPRSSRTYKFLQKLLCECSVKISDFTTFNGGAFKFLKYV